MNATAQITTYKEAKAALDTSVAFIGNTGNRAFDAVVFELTAGTSEVLRTITLKTSGYQNYKHDARRVNRIQRALMRQGFRLNFSALHRHGSVAGTIRLWKSGFSPA